MTKKNTTYRNSKGVLTEKIKDKIRKISSQYPFGGFEGDMFCYEIWIESNKDFIYIKTLNYQNTKSFLLDLKLSKLYPFHLFRVKKVTWDEYEDDWDTSEPFQSAKEIM